MYNRLVWDDPKAISHPLNFSKSAIAISSRSATSLSLSRISFESLIIPQFSDTSDPIISKNDLGVYEITGAGIKVSESIQDCRALKLKCQVGTDKECEPYKCIYGTLEKTNRLWKYSNNEVDIYYEPRPLVKIKNISRGSYNGVQLSKPASYAQYLSFFELADFTTGETTYEALMREIASIAFTDICKSHEACILSNLQSTDNIDLIYYGVITYLYNIEASEYWINYIRKVISSKSLEAYLTSRDLLKEIVLELIGFNNCFIQLQASNVYSQSKIDLSEHSRPIYTRLPEVYKIDELDNVLYTTNLDIRTNLGFEPDIGFKVIKGTKGYTYLPRRITDYKLRDTLGLPPLNRNKTTTHKDLESWKPFEDSSYVDTSKYVLSGADCELYNSKTKIDSFYSNVLDPDTCYEPALDWVASLLGLISPIWDSTWSSKIKRAIIKNCLGWFNIDIFTTDVLGDKSLNIKGKVLSEFPFNNYTDYFLETSEDNYLAYDFSSVFPKIREYSETTELVSETDVSNLTIRKTHWEGLYATKGTFIQLLWWNMLLNLERFDATHELEVYDSGLGVYKVSTYLDNPHQKLNIPIKFSYCQAGTPLQAQLNSYTNQAVCGISQVFNISELFRSVLICLPFRYNRNGKMWRTLQQIYEYWMPINHKPHIQYGVFAAGYSAADDVFLEVEHG